MADDKARYSPFAERRLLGEGDERYVDVRIVVEVIRMTVVAIVLADPPLLAHPEEKIVEDQPADDVLPPSAQDLQVTDVVGKETNLAIHEARNAAFSIWSQMLRTKTRNVTLRARRNREERFLCV